MEIHDAALKFSGETPSAGTMTRIDAIVLHHRAGEGGVESLHAQHLARGWWGIGYHYYVDKRGEIWRGRPERFAGAHAGSRNRYNLHSIGICFEGNFERERMPEAQLAAGRELIRDICARYDIRECVGHGEISATACPGRYFPADEMKRAAVRQQDDYSAEAVAWAQAAGILRGKGDAGLALDDHATRREIVTMLYRALAQQIENN